MKINSLPLYRSEVRRCNLPRHYRSSIVSASIAKRYNRATDPGQRKKKEVDRAEEEKMQMGRQPLFRRGSQ